MGKNVIISTLPNISQNYLPKVNTSNIFANSLVYDNGTNVLIGTTIPSTQYSTAYLTVGNTTAGSVNTIEVRGSQQSALALTKGLTASSTTPTVEIFNSGNFGIVSYRPGVVSSNYLMYYDSDSVSNRSLSFQTEGQNRLIINQNGTVQFTQGITGTSATFSGSVETASPLTIKAAAPYIQWQNASATRLGYIQHNATNLVYNADTGIHVFNQAATFSSSVTANGDMYITNANPILHLNRSNNATSPAARINFETSDNTVRWQIATNQAVGTGFEINQGDGATNRLYINTSGNVGIGTTSPGSKLDVYTGSGATLRVTSGGTNILNVGNYSAADGFREFLLVGSELSFYTGTAGGGSASERMRIGSDGAVQMKHTNSFATLRLGGGNGVGEGRIYLEYNGNSSYIDCFGDNTYKDLVISANNLKFNSAGSQRMIITSGGNLEFMNGSITWGYENQGIKLSKSGVGPKISLWALSQYLYLGYAETGGWERVYAQATSGGVYLTNGATSWTANSDERLKTINSGIQNAIDKILTLRAVNYSWKSDELNRKYLGLIAQDVQKVLPELVDKDEKDEINTLGIRYTEMIPVLVKAIQELKAENDQQKADIESLKALINK